MPGAILRVGLGRAPAVTRDAFVAEIRARAESSAGLKYSAASDNVCRSQDWGGHGEIAWPRFCSSKYRRPGSARFRDSNCPAVALTSIGAAWHLCRAQPAKQNKPAKGEMYFQTLIICFSMQLKKVNEITGRTSGLRKRPQVQA